MRNNKQVTPSEEGQRFQEALQSGEFTNEGRLRKMFRFLPSDPRCRLCNAPFHGIGGSIVKLAFNKYPSNYNPKVCNTCFDEVRKGQIGVEIELSFLFADVRGSTNIAEGMSPAEFRQLINHFYQATTHVLVHSDALIDKLIGDEVAAFFVPGFVGSDHASKAVEAAKKLLKATGHGEHGEPWIPVGVGIHTGQAWLGAVGSSENVTDITALGDAVNVASRLASQAGPGEILLSEEVLNQADFDPTGLETRELDLKGKSESMSVWVMHAEDPILPTVKG